VRLIIEFQGFEGNEKASLKVHCFNEKYREIDNLNRLLKRKGFTITYVCSNSLRASIFGEFNQINRIGKELREKGFEWSEDILKAGAKQSFNKK